MKIEEAAELIYVRYNDYGRGEGIGHDFLATTDKVKAFEVRGLMAVAEVRVFNKEGEELFQFFYDSFGANPGWKLVPRSDLPKDFKWDE